MDSPDPSSAAAEFSASELRRFSRHLILPGIGFAGQSLLKRASVLCIGAGGLGSPALLYLAAAGVGRLGIIDPDTVSESNLQRQILFDTADTGQPKTAAAARRLLALYPELRVETWDAPFTAANALTIAAGFDILLDATDNFPSRYLSSDVAVWLKKPLVYGSIFRFEGQTTVFAPHLGGPCYRCMFPVPPAPDSVPSCADGGVLGVLAGLIGTLQATETLKLITGTGTSLTGRMLHVDTRDMRFREFRLRRDPACPVCGENPVITAPVDYHGFCGVPSPDPGGTPDLPAAGFLRLLREERDAVCLVDVREPWEHALLPCPSDLHIPWQDLGARAAELPANRRPLLYCRVGERSREAAARLRATHPGAASLAGGLEGLPEGTL